MGNSPIRPLLVGAIAGFLIGLIIGLFYAWQIDPAVYSDGARFSDLNQLYLENYGYTVAEAYMTTRDTAEAHSRLADLAPAKQIELLARAEKEFRPSDPVKADTTITLAQELRSRDNWSDDAISQGLTAAEASPQFADALGQAPVSGDSSQVQPTAPGEPTQEAPAGGGALSGALRLGAICILGLLVIAVGAFLLTRIRRPQQRKVAPPPEVPEVVNEEGETLQPLRQWVGTYTLGQDNYDESFTVETPESDFLGECGMGILDGFASGTPKKVAAFDVWLFDKTDIRTVSMPIMSRFAFEDDILRGKVSPDATPILGEAGTTFDIETTALLVKAIIEEVEYGDEAPADSYFERLKVSLTAYLKPGADVHGDMPLPEGFEPA